MLGANGALAGFLGVISGGRIADALRVRDPAGRILVIMFGVVAPIVPIWVGYTTVNPTLFYVMNFLAVMFGATALGAAAATTQDLVLPRMRGTATASFFLATTLVGLSFGPYMVGQISDIAGSMVDGKLVGDLRTGILWLVGVAPVALGLLIYAVWQLLPAQRRLALPDAVARPLALAAAGTGAWVVLFAYEQIGLSVLAMLIILGSLIIAYSQARELVRAGAAPHWVSIPLALFLGWISVATVVNLTLGLRQLTGPVGPEAELAHVGW